MLKKAVLCLLMSWASLVPQFGLGQGIVVTRGPYLQMRGSSNIVVRWRTAEPADSYVLCGTNVNSLDLGFSDATVTTEHEVGLSNLQAQTTYFYAIGSQTSAPLSDPEMYFTTSPPVGSNRPVRVWFVSDYGFQDDNEIAVRVRILPLQRDLARPMCG